ncbi:MAG: DUF2442 domain-containing protein [Gallionellaceae bacterium]|nr:DUF2442 domain-containing protein [Gallionellaceae bacterium]
MDWDVVEIGPKPDLSMELRFADGTRGRVQLEETHLLGVFGKLKDPTHFCQAYLEDGVVTWPENIDIAPDAMYREIKQHGQWVLR